MNLADLARYLWPDGYEGRQPQDTYQIDTSLGVNIVAAVTRGNYDVAARVFRLVSGSLPLAVTAGGIGLKNTGISTNYLTIPAPIGAGTVFAVLAVYVPNTATGTHLICDADNSPTDRDFQLRQNGTAVEFIRFNTTPSAVTASVSGALKIGAPTTILAISDSVNVTLYAGSGIGTATITGSPSSWTCSGEWLSRSSNHTGTPLGTDGSLCLGAYITGAVPPATAKMLVSNPWSMFVAPVDVGWPIAASVGGSYTLTAQSGTYNLTGQSAQLLKSKLLISSGGTYQSIGSDASIYRSRQLSLSGGTYSISGASAAITFTGLSANYLLTAQGGTYSLAGASADITYTALSPSYILTAQGGTYSLTGNSAEIKKSKRLVASGGAYSYAGQQITITAGPAVVSNLVRYINVLTGEVMILKPF